MIKKLFITCFIIFWGIHTHAQTLKITDLQCSEEKLYKETAEKTLGKNLVLTVYDQSIKIVVAGDSKPIFLRQVSDGNYSGITEESDAEAWSANLKIDKTFGIITSAILIITVSEKGGMHRSDSWTVTAKRF